MTWTDETLLGLIYEGPLEEMPWLGFLHALRRELGAVSASLNGRMPGPHDRGFDVSVADGDLTALRAVYSREFHASNPFRHAEMLPGKAYRWSDFVDEDEFRESRFYREFCRPLGYEFAMCLCLRSLPGGRVWLHAVRGLESGEFNDREVAWLESLAPHFHRSLRLLDRLRAAEVERTTFESATSQLEIGTLVLDREGRILSSNQHAREIVARNRGLSVADHRLRLHPSSLDRNLRAALERIENLEPPAEEILAVQREGSVPLGILIRALTEFGLGIEPRPAVALYLMDSHSQSAPSGPFLQSLFGLTKAEGRMASLLVEGRTIAEAASTMGISDGSARTYSKRIFGKMGVSRQADLVRTVLTSVASLTRIGE